MTGWMAAMVGAAANVATACAQPGALLVSLGEPGVSDVACGAAAPSPGQAFGGVVLRVIDGRTVCLAKGPSPSQWVRATLDDSHDASARPAVMSALFGKRIDCAVVRQGPDGPVARCTLDGEPVGRLIDSSANRQAAVAWR